jgi:transposase
MSHSKDLREKALNLVKQGWSIKDICVLFEISRSSFQRWRLKQEFTGSVAPKVRESSPYKLDNDQLKSYVKKNPDAYLSEIALHFKVTASCICTALQRLKITRKKRPRSIKKEIR